MALQRLLAVLTQEADTEASALLEGARAEVAARHARTEAGLAARREEVTRAWELERERALTFSLAVARQQARETELLARDRLLERVLSLARERLPAALTRPEFLDPFPALVTEALACLGRRPGELRAAPSLVPLLQGLTAGQEALDLRADPTVGTGFRLASRDGTLEIDATLEGRLRQLAPRLRQEILARLERTP